MNQEEQKYFEDLFDLFGHPGWKSLTQQLEQNKASVSTIRGIPDSQTLHFRQGQLDIIDLLLNLKAITEQSFKAAQETSE